MEVGGDSWVEPQASDPHHARPARVWNDHPFLSGGIAHDRIHCRGISVLPAVAQEESVAAVLDVNALIFRQERQ